MFPVQKRQDEVNAFELTSLSLSIGVQGIQQNQFPSQAVHEKQDTSSEDTRSCEERYKSQKSLRKSKRLRSLDGEALLGSGSSSNQLKIGGVGCGQEQLCCASFGPGKGVHGDRHYKNKQHSVDHVPGGGKRVREMNGGYKAYPYLASEDEQRTQMSAYGPASVASVSEKLHLRMIKNREAAARSRARKQVQEVQHQLEITELKKENGYLKGAVREVADTLEDLFSTILAKKSSVVSVKGFLWK